MGLDSLFFSDVVLLPDIALEFLGQLLKRCVATLALPTQVLLQLTVLPGKKSGGSRTIAILTTFYRLLMRMLAPTIADWDVTTAGPWDSALRGNSALRAHVARAVDIELADFEELFVVHFLWDMRKFYDSIRINKLVEQLDKLSYNPFILVLGLITHKGPRTLMVGQSCSEPIMQCGRSILAGCQQSCSWARGLLHALVESLGYIMPGSICNEHVDDLSQIVTSSSKRLLYDGCLQIGDQVQHGVKELDIFLSDKSVLLSNTGIANLIASELNKRGITISVKDSAPDLGIETAAGRQRCAAGQNSRIKKAKARAKRGGYLTRIDSTAHKLGPTGVQPQQAYGHVAQGASRCQTTQMRRNLWTRMKTS